MAEFHGRCYCKNTPATPLTAPCRGCASLPIRKNHQLLTLIDWLGIVSESGISEDPKSPIHTIQKTQNQWLHTCISAVRQSRLYRPTCCCREAPSSVSHPLSVPSFPTELCPYVVRRRPKALDLCDALQTCDSGVSGNSSVYTSPAVHGLRNMSTAQRKQ